MPVIPCSCHVRTFVGSCQQGTLLHSQQQQQQLLHLQLQLPEFSAHCSVALTAPTENMSRQGKGPGEQSIPGSMWSRTVESLPLVAVTLLSCGCRCQDSGLGTRSSRLDSRRLPATQRRARQPSFNQHYLCLNQLKTNYVSCPVERATLWLFLHKFSHTIL